MIISRAWAGKHYAVYGLARSGLATVEALLASGAKVTAWDAKKEARAKVPAGAEIADLDSADLSQFDSLVVTPGLPLNSHPIATRARAAGVEIIGDVELFARARPELPPHKMVGITGTNGKSTTTALIHHILKSASVPTAMGGNIGLPILAQDPLTEGGVYVLELSSYQIDLTQSLDCDVAVLLNITPDHLDRYDSFEAYAASKIRLLEMQQIEHRAFLGRHPAITEAPAMKVEWKRRFEPLTCPDFFDPDWVFKWHLKQDELPSLQGPHNAENIAAAVWAVMSLQLMPTAQIMAGLRTYPGLPHRMERVREKDGVTFVNDSKATNATASAPALAAFDPIRWICGGRAKSGELDECAPFFPHVAKAYTIGESGELCASLLSPHIAVAQCHTLARAVAEAAGEAQPGDTVLLSPACASFDQYRDFEQRGDEFRGLVEAL